MNGRPLAPALLSAFLLPLSGCGGPQAGGSGSSTNWLRSCESASDCGQGLPCECGYCALPCTENEDCSGLDGANCSNTETSSAAAMCAEGRGNTTPAGLCLPACDDSQQCPDRLACVQGTCVPETLIEEPCGLGSTLSVTAGSAPLVARQGMLFSETWYEPVVHPDVPADWVEPLVPVEIVAQVTDSGGVPLGGCPLSWEASSGSGWAYPDSTTTNAEGEVRAIWVAGTADAQELEVALEGPAAGAIRASVTGEARPHDAEPRASDPEIASAAVAATSVVLNFPLSDSPDAIKLEMTPLTFPPQTFYVAAALPGFFAGLQNTSMLDASTNPIEDDSRLLLASVWNTAEQAAVLLMNDAAVTCGPHTDSDGGIKCELGAAWELGEASTISVEYLSLEENEEAPLEYAELGYLTDPCASPEGCTDYTVWLHQGTETGLGRRLVAYRHPAARAPSQFSSYTDIYSGQMLSSCLAHPSYRVLLSGASRIDGSFQEIATPTFRANYASHRNAVCHNYVIERREDAFLLGTGGMDELSRPLLPTEASRVLAPAEP